MSLILPEKETIINFNEGEEHAHIFTYNKTWQSHLEKDLGLTPTLKNQHGGRGYKLPKKLIPMPRKPRVVVMTKAKLDTLKKARNARRGAM